MKGYLLKESDTKSSCCIPLQLRKWLWRLAQENPWGKINHHRFLIRIIFSLISVFWFSSPLLLQFYYFRHFCKVVQFSWIYSHFLGVFSSVYLSSHSWEKDLEQILVMGVYSRVILRITPVREWWKQEEGEVELKCSWFIYYTLLYYLQPGTV